MWHISRVPRVRCVCDPFIVLLPGGYFCGGYDLKSLSQTKETPRNFLVPQGKNETGPMVNSTWLFFRLKSKP